MLHKRKHHFFLLIQYHNYILHQIIWDYSYLNFTLSLVVWGRRKGKEVGWSEGKERNAIFPLDVKSFRGNQWEGRLFCDIRTVKPCKIVFLAFVSSTASQIGRKQNGGTGRGGSLHLPFLPSLSTQPNEGKLLSLPFLFPPIKLG